MILQPPMILHHTHYHLYLDLLPFERLILYENEHVIYFYKKFLSHTIYTLKIFTSRK